MDFYKKILFISVVFILMFAVLVKIAEPVISKQINEVFADKKFSKKLTKELINSTEDFTAERREFYKDIIKKLYKKWKPLIEESINEANEELKK